MTTPLREPVPAWWDEREYLALHPDVTRRVSQGEFADGYAHFVTVGQAEGRAPAIRSPGESDWRETAYLAANPDVAAAVELGTFTSGLDHYRRHGRKEGRPFAGEAEAKDFGDAHELPSWLADHMLRVADIEPALTPTLGNFNDLHHAPLAQDQSAYLEVLRRLRLNFPAGHYTHFFMLPWIKRGGSDLELIHIINYLAARSDCRIAVTLSEATGSDWLHKLSSKVHVFDLGNDDAHTDFEEKVRAVLTFLAHVQPSVVHVSNCTVGWKLLTRNGAALSQTSRLFASLFCYDYGLDGEPFGYARLLGAAAPYLSGVIVDNQTFRDHVVEHYGVPSRVATSIRFPVDATAQYRDLFYPSAPVLWASRLDRQKRPELVAAIAKLAPEIEFEMYGSAVLESEGEVLASISDIPNLSWLGPYSGFANLPRRPYRCFLYTSAWDGLPNVVLEVMASGLPLVTANVGGIHEVVDGQVGYLIDDHTRPERYVEILRQVRERGDEALRRRDAALERIALQHSEAQFEESIARIPGYLPS